MQGTFKNFPGIIRRKYVGLDINAMVGKIDVDEIVDLRDIGFSPTRLRILVL